MKYATKPIKDFMHDYWYIACKIDQLKNKPLKRKILGNLVVIFRDQDGKVGVLKDACIHRNFSLSRGVVCKSGLQCTYHGWTFDTQGNCSNIPAQTNPETKQLKTRSWPAIESQGFVWVYMGLNKPITLPQIPELPLYQDPKANTWVMERIFEGNALHCVENFLDIPHTIFVHKKIFRNESNQKIEFEVSAGKNHVQAEFFNEAKFDTFLGKLLMPNNVVMKHTDVYMRPYTTRVDYYFSEQRQFIVQSHCVPISLTRTRVFTWMAFRFDPMAKLIRLIFEPLANHILDQDMDVIREQTADIKESGQKTFLFHETDVIGKEIFKLAQGQKLPTKIRKGSIYI